MKRIAVAAILAAAMSLGLASCSAPQEKLEVSGASISYPADWTGDVQDLSSGKFLGVTTEEAKAIPFDLDGKANIVVAEISGSNIPAKDFVGAIEAQTASAKEQGVDFAVTTEDDRVKISAEGDGMHIAGVATIADGNIAAIALVTGDESAWSSHGKELEAVANSLTS